MATIYTKIHEYNKAEQTIVVSFASSETKSQDPDNYQKLNYNVTNLVELGATKEELKIALSRCGEEWCKSFCKKEMLDDNSEKQTQVQNLVGTVWEKTTKDLEIKDDLEFTLEGIKDAIGKYEEQEEKKD